MFTGIITQIGIILTVSPSRLVVACDLTDAIGDSVAIDGCCLTVVDRCEIDGQPALVFDVIPATVAKTIVGSYGIGTHVNLEPALAAGDRIGGHWVQGHVDGTGAVVAIISTEDSYNLQIEVADQVAQETVDRGSICINGVSLTVMAIDDRTITVSLIPETLRATNLSDLQEGSLVNIEGDILSKYVQKAVQAHLHNTIS